jgi:hypothetical protein
VGYTHRFISLTEQHNAELAIRERSPGINTKVHLRASVIHFSNKHHPIAWLVSLFKRNRCSINLLGSPILHDIL